MKWTKESHSKSCFILACRRFYFLKYLYICRKDDLTVNQFLWEKSWGKKIGAKIVVGGLKIPLKVYREQSQRKTKTYFHHIKTLNFFICSSCFLPIISRQNICLLYLGSFCLRGFGSCSSSGIRVHLFHFEKGFITVLCVPYYFIGVST